MRTALDPNLYRNWEKECVKITEIIGEDKCYMRITLEIKDDETKSNLRVRGEIHLLKKDTYTIKIKSVIGKNIDKLKFLGNCTESYGEYHTPPRKAREDLLDYFDLVAKRFYEVSDE